MSKRVETFNAQAEVERIRARRSEARRKLYRKSRLSKFRAELVAMNQAGASCADLVEWLRVYHRCKVNRSTIDRYLKKLPELSKVQTVAVELAPVRRGGRTMPSFRSPQSQSEHAISQKVALGKGRHNHQKDGKIHSVGTARSYEQALQRSCRIPNRSTGLGISAPCQSRSPNSTLLTGRL